MWSLTFHILFVLWTLDYFVEVQVFIGIILRIFLNIALPLTTLLQKDVPFNVDDNCRKTFNLLKEKLTTTLIL